MGQGAILCSVGVWLVEVLISGNKIMHFTITVMERLSQVFNIMLRLILYFP